MNPFFYRSTTNFGDHMNSWIWEEVAPEIVADRDDGIRLVGIGSLLSRNLDLVKGEKVVFGTGSGYSTPPTAEQASRWKIYCVRGPLTAKLLGLAPDKAVTDAAWLVNQVPRFANLSTRRRGTVFVPHWTSSSYGDWGTVCKRCDIEYVDPFLDCERVFSHIANAELAIVESLHGAIMADYYRTPWIAVSSPERVLTFKWLDWCQSLGLEYRPYVLPPSDVVDGLIQGFRPGQIDARLRSVEMTPESFDVIRTMPPPKTANLAYRTRTQFKSIARRLRTQTLEGLMQVRGQLVPSWNARHRDSLVEYFNNLQRQRPMLSSATVRNERIAQLNERLDAMRREYSLVQA